MGKYIVKYNGLYGEWSTVSDYMASYFMPLGFFRRYYLEEYGRASKDELEKRLARVEKQGTSSFGRDTFEELVEVRNLNHEETTVDRIFEVNRGTPRDQRELEGEAAFILKTLFEDEKCKMDDSPFYERMSDCYGTLIRGVPSGEADIAGFMSDVCSGLLMEQKTEYSDPHIKNRMIRFLNWKEVWDWMLKEGAGDPAAASPASS